MADSKVTSMTSASSLASTDVMYVVKPATSPYDHKVTIANLFGGIPAPVTFENLVMFGGSKQSVSNGGSVDTTKTITVISEPDGSYSLTIGAGTEGQTKFIVMSSNTAGHAIVLTGDIGHTAIQFDMTGATAQLLFVGNKWYFVGGTATVVE